MNRGFLSFTFFFLFSFVQSAFIAGSSSEAPVIICLSGTCSSGKSTLISSLALLREDLEIIDEDALVREAYPKAIAQRFPLEYASIIKAIDTENIYHSLRTKDIIYKKTAKQEECSNALKAIVKIQDELNKNQNLTWKQKVSQGITNEIIHKIQLALQYGKDVLLDAWYVKGDDIQTLFPKTAITRVMIYCSLPVAYERLLKRNAEAIALGNLEEKRFVGQLVGSFCSLYQISTQPLHAIQRVDRDELDHIFKAIYQTLTDDDSPKPIFTFKELSRSQLKMIQSRFLQPFEEREHSSVVFYITPKEKQDLIIDNTSADIQEAVRAIENFIKNPA